MQVGNYLIHATTVGALLFMLGYGFLAPWYRSAIGRNLMAVTFALLLIFGWASTTLLFGPAWAARDAVRTAIAGVCCVAVWWRVGILVKTQIMRRNNRVEQVR